MNWTLQSVLTLDLVASAERVLKISSYVHANLFFLYANVAAFFAMHW